MTQGLHLCGLARSVCFPPSKAPRQVKRLGDTPPSTSQTAASHHSLRIGQNAPFSSVPRSLPEHVIIQTGHLKLSTMRQTHRRDPPQRASSPHKQNGRASLLSVLAYQLRLTRNSRLSLTRRVSTTFCGTHSCYGSLSCITYLCFWTVRCGI